MVRSDHYRRESGEEFEVVALNAKDKCRCFNHRQYDGTGWRGVRCGSSHSLGSLAGECFSIVVDEELAWRGRRVQHERL